jgi:uncharacterized repeat protein (TIGR01451 family)
LFTVLAMLTLARIGSAEGVADLILSVSIPPANEGGVGYAAGSNLVYTFSITNLGPSEATDVVFSNQLPASVTFVSATGGSIPTNGVLLLNLGSLAAGSATNSIQIVEQPSLEFPAQSLGRPIGQLTNVFQVFANQTNSDPALNSAFVVTTVIDAYPGTPIAWTNPGEQTVVTYSRVFGGEPIPIQVGAGANPATTGQPGDIVLLSETNDYVNPTNWAAVVRFFNSSDLTGTNGLAATYSQVFFPTNFGDNSFANFQLSPEAFFISYGTETITNDITNIVTTYNQFGPADGIVASQTDIGILSVQAGGILLKINHTNNNAIVSWSPLVYGWTLQTNNDLTNGTWGNYTGTITNNSETNAPLTGNVFFRLIY